MLAITAEEIDWSSAQLRVMYECNKYLSFTCKTLSNYLEEEWIDLPIPYRSQRSSSPICQKTLSSYTKYIDIENHDEIIPGS